MNYIRNFPAWDCSNWFFPIMDDGGGGYDQSCKYLLKMREQVLYL